MRKTYNLSIKGNVWIKELIVDRCKKRLVQYTTMELLIGIEFLIELSDMSYKDYCYFKKIKKVVEEKK